MPLPTPQGRQKEVLYLPSQGHFVVLGTAGSGKTTLAILRAAYLSNPRTEHRGKTLLVTFNRTLVTYLQSLQKREKKLNNVVIENYHRFARGYLASRRKISRNSILDNTQKLKLIEQALQKIKNHFADHPLVDKPVSFFEDEFRWMSQQGILTLENYQRIESDQFLGTRILPQYRDFLFLAYQQYQELLSDSNYQYDWDNIATTVCQELEEDTSTRRYKHIIIDEGQDFSPEMIRSLSLAIPADGSLTFFGDIAQQIYGHRISWRSAGLNVSDSEIWEFEENYRNSKQIAQLSLAIAQMSYFRGVPDLVEPQSPSADGPLPTIVKCNSRIDEISLVVQQAIQIIKQSETVAILCRDRKDEKQIKQAITSRRYLPESVQLHKKMQRLELNSPKIYYGTYHSAKGLEFDLVILPFCNKQRLPDPQIVETFGETEAMSRDGRLLYVGVTRAKSRLLITYHQELTELLPLNPNLYRILQHSQ
ncbi:3'-5' exonuclease [Spirulina sp. CS-785/01]|uniref:3'-5' exonuclease n=1 Tax=Spirulina sp. CS-785/01 TaxID=3021716 RepID=UPI00232AD5A3|nr:3'-5' exonuclease [Spirulina sp. CS-785/01]MDB9315947.1 3'-5' exonuclease [Spirulina sp. CS-785/01]